MAVVFFFENPTMGGTPLVIIRYAQYLHGKGVPIKLIMHPKSPVSNTLRDLNIDHQFISLDDVENGRDIPLDDNDILVVFHLSSILRSLFKYNPRLVFYNVFPDHIVRINVYKFGVDLKSFTKRAIRKMTEKKALFLMDIEGTEEIKKQLGMNLAAPIYLPIPINEFGERKYNADKWPEGTSPITITYVGRAETWKILPVNRILKDISSSKGSNKYRLIIITDNKDRFSRELVLPNDESIEVIYKENVFGEQLEHLLRNEADLHFAMGTACLDGAKLGVPSILVDPCSHDLPDTYRYRWMFEAKGYSVGSLIKQGQTHFEGHTLNTILSSLSTPEGRENISARCYNYVYDNHRQTACGEKFLTALNNSSLRLTELKNSVIYFSGIHQLLKKAVKTK